MATYENIRDYVQKKYGFYVGGSHIADVKEQCGIFVKQAHNRDSNQRKHSCPADKVDAIKDALKYFGMI